MFDARAYYASLDLPEFIDPTGRVHKGRILGTDHWQRLQVKLRLSKNSDGSYNPKGLNKAMRMITEATFPSKWWKPWEKSVADWIWELPEIGRMRAVWDFMRSQAKSRGTDLPENLGTLSLPILPLDKQDGLLDVPPTPSSL